MTLSISKIILRCRFQPLDQSNMRQTWGIHAQKPDTETNDKHVPKHKKKPLTRTQPQPQRSPSSSPAVKGSSGSPVYIQLK
ncbi:predicted protein [Chaetomium globosum CBS 148.51]|uniref:Uncharacterized protein n=1 Tax=Chaetomium globosum (strain ATCC 6205 / CBS 148.51 / DSM 1962 / NBRC 6347 / NRRL 1970) TaxID=306901 RepID=Q2HGL2_CHAGB|nr:uncharacterized protein CHGG_00642 [Chaetomium globosum CBS 148.51]EAQ92407.1 predicted protein [Chaetomium globosum CBS 148.51]